MYLAVWGFLWTPVPFRPAEGTGSSVTHLDPIWTSSLALGLERIRFRASEALPVQQSC
jgi:hypothetical protein